MIFVEDARGFDHVELVVRTFAPRQLRHVLEERPDDLRLHRLAPDALEPRQLAVDFLAHVLRQRVRRELLLQLLEVRCVLALAFSELLLDRPKLLAQHHLALAVADLLFHLRLDVFLRREDADLPLDVHEHAAEAVFDGKRLEKLLPFGRRDVDVARDEVREAARLVDLREELLHGLFGKPHLRPQLGSALTRFLVQGGEKGVLRVRGRHLVGIDDDGFEHAVLLLENAHRDSAPFPLEQKAHAARSTLNRTDGRDRADHEQAVGRDALDVRALRHGEDLGVVLPHGQVDGAERSGAPCGDREADAGEQDGVTQREYGESQSFRHAPITTPDRALFPDMSEQTQIAGSYFLRMR